MKILCIGEEWRGSNSSGLFYAMSRAGQVVNIVNELRYISGSARSFTTKVLNRLSRSFQRKDFNEQLLLVTKVFKPDLIFIYKGRYVEPESIHQWKKMNLPVVNFFPDVSFLAHGPLIPQCVPLYDAIFTTKTFAADDLHARFGIDRRKVKFIPHGYDPLVHRPLTGLMDAAFNADVSFIGNYSKWKAECLAELKENLPTIDLKIWGWNWYQNTIASINDSIQGIGVHGDLYAMAINCSRINMGLLSERVEGASRGDLITSRTFHIPGAGGFMIHQMSAEVPEYFNVGEEIETFDSSSSLAQKVDFYLKNESRRLEIAKKGHLRATKDHSLDSRAARIIEILKEENIIGSDK